MDIFEVIEAIRVRPTHSNIRQPGFGVGGYCLTKDPLFAQVAARELFGLALDFPFSEEAVRINGVMPFVTLDRIDHMLDGLDGPRLLMLGASYRGGVADTRHSPSAAFASAAAARGAEVVCHDPLVTEWELPVAPVQELPDPAGFDAVVFGVVHDGCLRDGPARLARRRPAACRGREPRAARQPAAGRSGRRLPRVVHRARGRNGVKHALVTGGCGFIGSHLARRLLDDGWAVDLLDGLLREAPTMRTCAPSSSIRRYGSWSATFASPAPWTAWGPSRPCVPLRRHPRRGERAWSGHTRRCATTPPCS